MAKMGPRLGENLFERNFPKSAKIGKNLKNCGKLVIKISVGCNLMRILGNPR